MNPIKTEEVTVRGKPVWEDPETGERYSEKTYSFDYGDGIIVLPTIDPETGQEYDIEELMSYVIENGPYDPFNGEKLPVFQSNEKADKYAQWRSDNQFNEDIYSENYWHQDAGMPYTSDESLDVYRPTFRDNLRLKIDQGLQGLGMSEGASYKVAKGVAGEQYPTDGGLGIGIADLTAMGIPMGLQEARRDYNAASDREDPTGMGMAVLDGALSLAEAAPVVGVGVKGAAKGIKKIANKVTDAYDPNSVGSFGANMFANTTKKTSDMSVLTADAETDALQTLGLDEATREQWRGINKVNQRQQRVPQIQDAATALKDGEITSAEYRELVESFQPIVPFDSVPPLPTVEEIASALNSDKVRKGIIGVNKGVEDGTYVASRLDIPAYEQYDTWVVSLHDGANGKLNGASIGYSQTAVLNDVTFGTVPKAAANIASGKDKTTIARIFGSWENKNPEDVHALAQQYMNDPEWTQVGMNPFRHSYFYDKATGEPVVEAAEVIQVGPLVLARGVKKASPDDAMFRINPKDENSPTFALGGLAEARKGITTEEGREMANKKFQLDQKEADKNGDGTLSKYEELSAEAVQKADSKYGMNCGGMMEPMIDEVSGNEIPIGSTAENVRDDIEIMISEGEYVLPADVVKWHGLKHIMEMQDEAKMGLMAMYAEGLIQYTDEEPETEEDEEAEEVLEDEDVPSEDVEVEYPAVEVEDELDDDGTEEEYPEMSVLPGMMKKSKIAFIS